MFLWQLKIGTWNIYFFIYILNIYFGYISDQFHIVCQNNTQRSLFRQTAKAMQSIFFFLSEARVQFFAFLISSIEELFFFITLFFVLVHVFFFFHIPYWLTSPLRLHDNVLFSFGETNEKKKKKKGNKKSANQ